MPDIKPGLYRHFKGNEYEVLFTARHSETQSPMVVYRAMYGEGGFWVRPVEMWNEVVERGGKTMPRFSYIGSPEIELRLESEQDYRASEELTREAFWNKYKPGCDEHYLLHQMRGCPDYVSELCFVAVKSGKVVGHIAYTKGTVAADDGRQIEAVIFGPLSVLPSLQGQGIGSRLILHTLDIARELGYCAVFIFGDPAYYHRFGFQSASAFHVCTSEGESFDAFMALELMQGSLSGAGSKFRESPVFRVDEQATAVFDGDFPPKEKIVTNTQLWH